MLGTFSIRELHQKIIKQEIKIKDIVEYYLANIKKNQVKFKPFLNVFDKILIKQMDVLQPKIGVSRNLPLLYGIPAAVKDNICIENTVTTAASKILKGFRSPFDATAIKKLRENGVLFLGKTNLDEFAMGSSTENSAFFTSSNPFDSRLVAGGSSGGSAAAVALNMAQFALGSDTGGSIRQPAAFCGVYGLKPTYGAVSRFGLIAMASSLDVIGPLARNLDDVFLVFDYIKGTDVQDLSSFYPKTPAFVPKKDFKVCYVKEYFEGCDERIYKRIFSILESLKKENLIVEEVSLPILKDVLPCYYIIMASEVSSNLARYDGIKYGSSKLKSSKNYFKNLLDLYLDTRFEFFGNEVKRRIFMGTFSLSYGYFEAYYLQALKMQQKIKSEFAKIFKTYDAVIGPTTPELAFKIGEKSQDPVKMYLSDIYTVPANLGGYPALSMPVGFIDGLPVGLQIMADMWNEPMIKNIAGYIEKIIK